MGSNDEHSPTIVVEDVHVTYRVHATGKVLDRNARKFGAGGVRSADARNVRALRGVSLIAHRRETIGVIGRNGAGKSTLLRAMTGLLPVTQGRVWAGERPTLLGINAALLPELSGEKNVKLGLMALGFSAAEAESRADEVAAFAEVERFITHPMRTYSSGMSARLRFAIAAAKSHAILLIDEALSVGDKDFRSKSTARIRELAADAGTVMIVSHSMRSILELSTRVIWIEHGLVRMDGDPEQVVEAYKQSSKQHRGED